MKFVNAIKHKTLYLLPLSGLICLLLACNDSIENKRVHLHERYYGVYIDHYNRRGATYKDSIGNEHWIFYVKTVITNDSNLTAQLQLNIPQVEYNAALPQNKTFKVLLIPDSIPLNTALSNSYEINTTLKQFLDSKLTAPILFEKTLQPKEEYPITIAFLSPPQNDLNPYLSIYSKGHRPHYGIHDPTHPLSLSDSILFIPGADLKQALAEGSQLSLGLAVRFFNPSQGINDSIKPYLTIPCGELNYIK